MQRADFPFLRLTVLFRTSVDCTRPTSLGEGISSVLNLLIQVLLSSRSTLTDTPEINFTSHLGLPEPGQVDP